VSVQHLFHIVDRATWAGAVRAGEYRPPSLADEGFVHLSFAGQVAATARRHYRGVAGLVVVEIDPDLLEGEVRVEDLAATGERFPHLYGPIPARAAVAVRPLAADPADGDEATGLR
jgi:uncharacterized protein (DUF952 family)